MCRINQLNKLMRCIGNKSPLFNGDLFQSDLIFMYVKNYCGYSQRACTRMILNNMIRLKVIDVLQEALVSPANIKKVTCRQIPKSIIRDMRARYNKDTSETVPQIFVYRNNQWYYIGGCDNFMKVPIKRNLLKNVPNDPPNRAKSLLNDKDKPAVALKL